MTLSTFFPIPSMRSTNLNQYTAPKRGEVVRKRSFQSLNFLQLLSSIALLVITIYWPRKYSVLKLISILDDKFTIGFKMTIILASLHIFLAVFGMIAVNQKSVHKKMLKWYQIISCVLISLAVATIGVFSFHFKQFPKFMNTAVKEFLNEKSDFSDSFTEIASETNCCGYNDSRDWFSSTLTLETARIPVSCCNQLNVTENYCRNVYTWKNQGLYAPIGCGTFLEFPFTLILTLTSAHTVFHLFCLSFAAGFYQDIYLQ